MSTTNRLAALSPEKLAVLMKQLKKEKKSTARTGITRRAEELNSFPVSFAQQRLWLVNQLEPESPSYNIAKALRINGELDVELLNRVFNEIVRRHESLRTTFHNVAGTPVQQIAAHSLFSVPVLDLSTVAGEDEVARLIKAEAREPFDLAVGPLLRTKLLRLAEEEHVLLLTMHHIISDGWSLSIFVREMKLLYEAYAVGAESPLPELSVQYADYAMWQREWLTGEVLDQQLKYWKERLSGAPEVLELPADKSRPVVPTHQAGYVMISLPAELSAGLQEVSRQAGVTLYMLLLAAFQTLLYRYTGQTDIVVGSPIANRNRAQVENLIGFFVNTLVLRTDLSGNPSFRELLARVREVCLGAYAHQDLPFEKLVEELQPDRTLSETPLFQVMFALQNAPSEREQLGKLKLSRINADVAVANFDLTMSLVETEGRVKGFIEYSAELFEAETIKQLGRHFERLLAAIVEEVDQGIGEVALQTPEELSLQLKGWNETAREFPERESLAELFERQVVTRGDAAALVSAAGEVSYAELNERANRLARVLGAQGVGAETAVGICLPRSVEMVVSILAVLKAGGVYVPLDGGYPVERLRYMCRDANVALVLTELDHVEVFLSAGVATLCLEELVLEEQSGTNPECLIDSEQLAYIVYTSGSTGQPKGVAITQRGVNSLVFNSNYLELGPGDTVPQLSNPAFDALTFELWGTLLGGGRLLQLSQEETLAVGQLQVQLHEHEVSALFLTTALFNEVARQGGFAGVGTVLFGGEAVDVGSVRAVLEGEGRPRRLLHVYGPTEATTFSSWEEVVEVGTEARTVPIGKGLSNRELYVLDERMQPVVPGVRGELYIGGAGLARGYVGRPELTAEKFVPHPFSHGERLYRTGDVVRQLRDGRIEFVGRVDQQVKVRGHRIELGEIETVLREHAEIRDAVVVVREQVLVGYVVKETETTGSAAEWRRYLKERLPEYMVPGQLVELAELPLNANGKVDRKALPEVGRSSEAEYVGPRTPVEEVVASIWSEVLGVEQVGVHDNFFELGGHSLLATRVVSQVRQALQVEIALRRLFEEPTVAGLATEVESVLRGGGESQAPRLERVGREMSLPLSYAQQRLWFIQQLDPLSVAYNVPCAFRFNGRLDREALGRSLRELVRRHESLRTRFPNVGGTPQQEIGAVADWDLSVIDLQSVAEGEREEQARQLVGTEARLPFDLEQGPVFRAQLFVLSESEHVLLLTMHHIISDGWSLGVMLRELRQLYGAYVAGVESPLPELMVQYADYAVWQREWLTGEVLDQQLEYWKERLSGAPEVLELPTDKPRPAVPSLAGASHSFSLSVPVSERLKELSRQEGVTLYMLLLAAFQTLLYRHTGQTDIVVGSPIANRNRAEVEGLIGFFVNTLVLRTDLSGNPSFRELLARVREVCLGAYAHQDLPFEKLVEELQPERRLSQTPLFQVLFALQNMKLETLQLDGVQLSRFGQAGVATHFDLSLGMRETESGLVGVLEYSTELFEAETITRLGEHYERLLTALTVEVEQGIGEVALQTPDELDLQLKGWNETAREYPERESLAELFERQVAKCGDAVALVSASREMSYVELNERANRLARVLRVRGVGAETAVGLCLPRSAEMVVSILAVLKSGGVYVPLDAEYPIERLRYMCRDANVALVLTELDQAAVFEAAGVATLCLEELAEEIETQAGTNLECAIDSEQLAYVVYTSGSTGQPKGVAVTQRSVSRLLFGVDYVRLDEKQCVLQGAPLTFDAATFELWGALLHGGRCVLAEERVLTSRELGRLVRQHGVTTMWLTASLFNSVVDEAVEELRGVEQLLVGGEALSVPHIRKTQEALGELTLVNGYGPTEGTTFTCCEQIEAIADGASGIAIGCPIGNTTVYVLDERMRPVVAGVRGELYIGGAGLARGYVGRPELTAEKFVPHPFSHGERLYRTGDVVRQLRDGRVEFVGRVDQQVKVRGHRIELGEIETVLREHAEIRDAVVVVRDQVLVGYVVKETEAVGSSAEWRRYLKERLPEYMVPGQLVELPELPLNANGKVDRQALPEVGRSSEAEYVGPRTPVEEVVASIWSEVLGVEQVGVHDNFFELGGHSLLATRVVSQVRQALQVEIALRRLFEEPTVAGLAAEVETVLRGGGESQAPQLERVGRDVALPLSYAQQRLWFIQQLDPSSVAYNVPCAFRFNGQLDCEALRRSLRELVRRHESLRTRFPNVGGTPQQEIVAAEDWDLSVIDLKSIAEGEREEQARQLVGTEARLPFDLEQGPVFRAQLFVLNESEHVLLLTMHHIISDGWSLGVMLRELRQLYGAYVAGAASPLPELMVQYADYAVWQRQWLTGEVLDQQLEYWKERLSGAPEVLELPTGKPRPAVPSLAGASHSFSLSVPVSERLKELSRQEGVTLYMLLLAAFQTLLYSYTGQTDIVVGSPIANRNRAEVEGLIGFFVNTLVLRTDLSGNPSFRELLARVREVCLGAYAHQDVPFEKLVEELQPERRLSQTPLFQVLFALQNMKLETLQLDGVQLSRFGQAGVGTHFDLSLGMRETESGLVGVLEYSTELFEAETITRLGEHYERLLTVIVEEVGRGIGELALQTPDELDQQLNVWNETARAFPERESLAELFERQVVKSGEAAALVSAAGEVSYAELNERANRLARVLRARGVEAETAVGICLPRSVEMVVSILAVLKAGGVYVPLDGGYPVERLRYMCRDANVALVLTELDQAAVFEAASVATLCLEELVLEEQPGTNLECAIESEQLAYVVYTSGSTGQPKGVAITQRGVSSLVFNSNYLELGPGDTVPQLSNPAFDALTFELWGTLLGGGRLLLLSQEETLAVGQLQAKLQGQEVSALFLTTALFNEVARQGGFAGVGTVLFGGEAVDVGSVRAVLEGEGRPGRLLHVYGPTEATTFSSWEEVEDVGPEARTVPIGKGLSNRELYVLDELMQPVVPGVRGELYIGGAGLARGYVGRPELTAEKFVPHPFSHSERLYRTGDVVRQLRDGRIEFVGRVDQQVKVRGHRIELGEIETVLREHAEIRDAVVVVREQVLVGYVVKETTATGSPADWRRYLKERLPEYMVPGQLVELPELPLNANGKVDRKALPEVGRSSEAEYVGPRTPVEEVVASIWSEVLGVEQLGVYDNFFELGGHSLLATQVISRIRNAFQVDLPVRAIFESPTIADQSTEIEKLMLAGFRLNVAPLLPVSRDADLPLSYAQQRLWFIDQFEPNNPSYNMARAIRLNGALDVEVLSRTFTEIARRHESLRTTFPAVNGEPLQLIHAATPVEIAIVDLSTTQDEDTRKDQVKVSVRDEARQPFDLSHGPLMRVKLLKLAGEEHVLLLTMHHIIGDGWSMGLFIREMNLLYEAYAANLESPLPELMVQYADYAVWQREWLAGEVLENQLAYWKDQLGGAPEVLELPTDRPRPPVQTYNGSYVGFILPAELAHSLKTLSRRENTSLFMLLLTAFQVLLSRYSGQEDISVGTPIANRHRVEVEGLIGFFVNTLVMRTDLTGNPSFSELLKRVRESCLGAYAHQDVPFEKLVEELQPERSLSHTPLFQVMFALHNAPGTTLDLHKLKLQPMKADTQTEMFDLTLDMTEMGQHIQGALSYNTDLFDESSIKQMVRHFVRLLEGIVTGVDRSVFELPLLTEDEQQHLLTEFDTPRMAQSPEQIQQLFEAQVERTPNAIAVVYEDQRLTFRQLNSRANQLAHHLRDLGVGPEVLVGLCVERSLEIAVSLLGIIKAGGAPVPLDPAYPQERLTLIIEDAQLSVLVIQEKRGNLVCPDDARVVSLDDSREVIAQQPADNLPCPELPDTGAYVIYTSGSTGRPKGVLVTHRGLVNHSKTVAKGYQLGPSDRALQFASINFDATIEEFFPTWISGGAAVIRPDRMFDEADGLVRLIEQEHISVVSLTASFWHEWTRQLLATGTPLPDSLRLMLVGSEKVALEAYTDWWKLAGDRVVCCNAYGPTEATVTALLYQARGVEEQQRGIASLPIGRPFAETQVYVLDKYLHPVPVGVVGELYLGGDRLARGYLRRPELTAERFIPHPFSEIPGARLYRTGDLARRGSDGEIECLGRVDEQVKIRGFRIELGEIELVLEQHPSVTRAVVVAHEVATGDKRLAAYLITDELSSIDADSQSLAHELKTYLDSRLPAYMIPSAFVLLPELPLTRNGKIDKRALPAPSLMNTPLQATYEAPRTAVEETIARIWQELLGVAQVGVNDDFFELGGHSMLAIRTAVRLQQEGLKVTPQQLFKHRTVAKLAKSLAEVELEDQSSHVVDIPVAPPALLPAVTESNALLALAPRENGERLSPENVFLTGATGYLGVYLLEQLLRETSAVVHCLVRAATKEEGLTRITDQFRWYFPEVELDELLARVNPVPGELGANKLGIAPDQYQVLAANVEVIYHAAADVRTIGDESEFLRANVEGTRSVIELAQTGRQKYLHHVSTTSISGVPADRNVMSFSERDFDIKQSLGDSPYLKTKFLAERLMREAMAQGVAGVVHRVGNLLADSRGKAQRNIHNNALYGSFRAAMHMGVAPFLPNLSLDLSAVDFVAQAIVAISLGPSAAGQTFHHANPHVMRHYDLMRALQAFGYGIHLMDAAEYARTLMSLNDDEAYQAELVNAMALFMASKAHSLKTKAMNIRIESDLTQEWLNSLGLKWSPPSTGWLNRIVQHCIDVSYVKPPKYWGKVASVPNLFSESDSVAGIN